VRWEGSPIGISSREDHSGRSLREQVPRRTPMSQDPHMGKCRIVGKILVCPSVIREVRRIRTGAIPRLKWTMYRKRPARPIKREPSLCILDSVFIFNTLVFSPLVALRCPIRTAKSPTFYC
jgi:hypothetical protein